MMRTTEAVAVHQALHNPQVRYVRTSYDTVSDSLYAHEVRTVHSATQQFRRVNVGPYDCLTQNLRKDSPNTAWVLDDLTNRKITWIIERGVGYVGQVKEYRTDDGKRTIEVWALHPNRPVYVWVEGRES